ncbi:hypothetical protein [Methylobacterium sp. CM6247]
MLALPALLIELTLALPIADRVPVFDVEPGCRDATTLMALDAGRQKLCLADEATAHAQVAKQWASYPAQDRTRCTAEAQLGGLASYVDLLECLTMARKAKAGDSW